MPTLRTALGISIRRPTVVLAMHLQSTSHRQRAERLAMVGMEAKAAAWAKEEQRALAVAGAGEARMWGAEEGALEPP